MPDVSMCPGGACPRKNSCYRFRAIPSTRQSFFAEAPYDRPKHCDYFWAIEAGDRLAPPLEEPHEENRASAEPIAPVSEVRSGSRFGPDAGDSRVSHPPGKITRKASGRKK